jgi:hypothetical protein
MKNWTSLPVVGLLGGILAVFVNPPRVAAITSPAVASAALSAAPAPVAEAPAPSPAMGRPFVAGEPAGTGALAGYVLEAMLSWKKSPIGAPMAEIARDIAFVSLDHPPLWPTDTSRARGAIVLATLAFFEGGFMPYVDNGKCNDGLWRQRAWRAREIWSPSICDGGRAYTLWQIHVEDSSWNEGVVLTPEGEWRYDNRPGCIVGRDLIASRRLAVKVAIAFIRKSLRVSRGLTGYAGDADKGSLRSRFADDYSRKHPYAP